MKRSSIHGPPNSPGGSEMLWITSSEICVPGGRSSQCSVDAKAVEAITEGAEGDAEQLGGRGLVEARGLERLGDRLALDLVEEVVQGQAARAERSIEWSEALLGRGLGEVQVGLGDRVVAAEGQRALEDVLQFAHVAGE